MPATRFLKDRITDVEVFAHKKVHRRLLNHMLTATAILFAVDGSKNHRTKECSQVSCVPCPWSSRILSFGCDIDSLATHFLDQLPRISAVSVSSAAVQPRGPRANETCNASKCDRHLYYANSFSSQGSALCVGYFPSSPTPRVSKAVCFPQRMTLMCRTPGLKHHERRGRTPFVPTSMGHFRQRWSVGLFASRGISPRWAVRYERRQRAGGIYIEEVRMLIDLQDGEGHVSDHARNRSSKIGQQFSNRNRKPTVEKDATDKFDSLPRTDVTVGAGRIFRNDAHAFALTRTGRSPARTIHRTFVAIALPVMFCNFGALALSTSAIRYCNVRILAQTE